MECLFYRDDEDDIIQYQGGYDEEHNLGAAESLVDSPEHAYCPHHKQHHCHMTPMSEDDEAHS